MRSRSNTNIAISVGVARFRDIWVAAGYHQLSGNSRSLGTEEHSSCIAGLRGEAISAASFKMGSFLPESDQPCKLERGGSSAGKETSGWGCLENQRLWEVSRRGVFSGWIEEGHGKYLSHLNLPPGPTPKVVLFEMPFIKTLDLAFNKTAQNVGWDPSGTQGQRKKGKKGVLFNGFPLHHSQSSTSSLVVEPGQCCGGSWFFFFFPAIGLGHRTSPNLQFYPFVMYICLHLLFLFVFFLLITFQPQPVSLVSFFLF